MSGHGEAATCPVTPQAVSDIGRRKFLAVLDLAKQTIISAEKLIAKAVTDLEPTEVEEMVIELKVVYDKVDNPPSSATDDDLALAMKLCQRVSVLCCTLNPCLNEFNRLKPISDNIGAAQGSASSMNSPKSSTNPLKKNGGSALPKSEEILRKLKALIVEEVPAEHMVSVAQVLMSAMSLVTAMEKDYESKDKKKRELESLVTQRSIIEVTEIVYLKKPSTKDINALSRRERWKKILAVDSDQIRDLRHQINGDSILKLDDFPDYVALAYDYLSSRIHRYVSDAKKFAHVELDDCALPFVGWPTAKRALKMLLTYCFSPTNSPNNSSFATPIVNDKKISAAAQELKPAPIRFDLDTEETGGLSVQETLDENRVNNEISGTSNVVESTSQRGNIKKERSFATPKLNFWKIPVAARGVKPTHIRFDNSNTEETGQLAVQENLDTNCGENEASETRNDVQSVSQCSNVKRKSSPNSGASLHSNERQKPYFRPFTSKKKKT